MKWRKDALSIIYTNLAFCMIKKAQPSKAIKAAQNAIEVDSTNFKAFYRLAQAYKDLNDFDNSTTSFKQAISLQPQDHQLRVEFKQMLNFKNATIKEQNAKMFGFFDKASVHEQMDQESKDKTLRQKIARQAFG